MLDIGTKAELQEGSGTESLTLWLNSRMGYLRIRSQNGSALAKRLEAEAPVKYDQSVTEQLQVSNFVSTPYSTGMYMSRHVRMLKCLDARRVKGAQQVITNDNDLCNCHSHH